MKLNFNGVLLALSTALDHVEGEVLGVSDHHSKRVAFMCTQMARHLGLTDNDVLHLTGAAVMHDNALTEYIAVKRLLGISAKDVIRGELAPHCEMGEKNAESLPFYNSIKDIILFHHENADGSGPFCQLANETPLFAQIIHVADNADAEFTLNAHIEDKYDDLIAWLEDNRGVLFTDEIVDIFEDALPLDELQRMEGEQILTLLDEVIPCKQQEMNGTEMVALGTLFAKITDYKSHFTSMHSLGCAQKAELMGKFYGDTPAECTQLFLIGALHDIGKLTIPNEILEKPARLSETEFETMKHHTDASYDMLKGVTNLEEAAQCAHLHHEKLDGSGYPLGKTSEQLTRNEKLFCCIDIYQALTEERPYKTSLTHDEAMAVMHSMVRDHKIDEKITADIDHCFSMTR